MEARSAAAGGPYQILVIPLLVEKNLAAHVDRVLVVDCDEALQLRRLHARDGSTPEQARAILAAQASRAARLKAADDVIRNDADLGAVRAPGRGAARALPGARRTPPQLSARLSAGVYACRTRQAQ